MNRPMTANEAADWLAARKPPDDQAGLALPASARQPRPLKPATYTTHFNLRPGHVLPLEIPYDLTEREAERFASFIRQLPIPTGSSHPPRRRTARHTGRGWWRVEGEKKSYRTGDLPPDVRPVVGRRAATTRQEQS